MTVRWTERAEADLDHLSGYIARDSVEAALAMQDRLLAAAGTLAQLPERGRRGRIAGTRELVVTGTPYFLVYHVREEEVFVLHVVHGAEDYPTEGDA